MENFETERLRFRAWREADAEDLFLCASDPDIGERAGWPPHKTVDDSLMVIKNIFSNGHTWALELKETGHVIGCMGYYPYGESNIEIGEQDVEVFKGMNHGQLLVDHPDEVARRIILTHS